MKRIEEHRTANCIKGLWGEPDPLTGPEWVIHDEMVRRTLERQTGESFSKATFKTDVLYHMLFKPDKKGPVQDGVPGKVIIRWSRNS